MQKSGDLPFNVGHDVFLLTLDIICAVSFGMEDANAALRQELAHLQDVIPSTQPNPSGVMEFPEAKMSAQTEALLDIAPMMSLGLIYSWPRVAQVMAMVINPRRAWGYWCRRDLIKKQTSKSLERLKAFGEAGSESALDQLLLREMTIAEKAGRAPQLYSAAIRDEVLLSCIGGRPVSANML
jgi:hypothetical protein